MNTRDIIALTMVKGIGNAFIKKNINQIVLSPSLKEFLSTSNYLLDEFILNQLLEKAEVVLDECQECGYRVVDISEAGYPKMLKSISDPPAVLYMLGNTKLLDKVIAIIGTRHSSDLGNRIAEKVGKYFSGYYSICNGLVEGIDSHSIGIRGTVIPNAIGVISGGLNYKSTCSASHKKIINEVLAAGGLIISEFEPNRKEDQFSGSKVSRIQAGLSSGLILVQSSVGGGSKYTIKEFSKLGRTIGVIHYPANKEYFDDSFSANHLIAEKGIDGIAQIVGLKSTKTVNIKSIVVLQGQNDYDTFIGQLQDNSSFLW